MAKLVRVGFCPMDVPRKDGSLVQVGDELIIEGEKQEGLIKYLLRHGYELKKADPIVPKKADQAPKTKKKFKE